MADAVDAPDAAAGACGGVDEGGGLGHLTCAPRRRGRPPRPSHLGKTRGCCCGRSAAYPRR